MQNIDVASLNVRVSESLDVFVVGFLRHVSSTYYAKGPSLWARLGRAEGTQTFQQQPRFQSAGAYNGRD